MELSLVLEVRARPQRLADERARRVPDFLGVIEPPACVEQSAAVTTECNRLLLLPMRSHRAISVLRWHTPVLPTAQALEADNAATPLWSPNLYA